MERAHAQTGGNRVAASVSWEVYLREYAHGHAEWVEGDVIRLSPVTLAHTLLSFYLANLLRSYLAVSGEGMAVGEPFVMRLPGSSAREPDLQVITTPNLGRLRDTYTDGPADLVIEIVSPESDRRDRVDKFAEYEQGGVAEYWILDPLHQEALFYRRTDGVFVRATVKESGAYVSAVLPRLRVCVSDLWRAPLPTPAEIELAVTAMLESAP